MTVKAILSAKGRDVVTVAPQTSLSDLCTLLAGKKIGAVVITDEGRRVLGIISERDVVRAVARGPGALFDPVSMHMTREVVTVREDVTVASLMSQMTQGRFRHLPVVVEGQLAGLISIGDVVKHRLEEMESEREALKEYITSSG